MGSYASVAIRDEYGNIVGYQSTRTGEVVEATSREYQDQVRLEGRLEEARTGKTIEPNPYDPYSAAGIAYDVARTGGATDVRLNLIAEQEIAAVGGDPSFIRYATNIYQEREPIPSSNVTTREGQTFYNRGFEGVPVRLNLTRSEMQNVNEIVSVDSNRYLVYNQDTRNLERLSPQSQLAVDYGVHKARGDFGGPLLEGGTYGGWKAGRTIEERRAAVALGVTTPETRMLGSRYQTTPRSPQGAEAAINAGALPKPFTSRNLGSVVEEPQKVMRPSDADLAIMASPVGATPVGKALVDISDFWIGGRTYQYKTTKAGPTDISEVAGQPDIEKTKVDGGYLTTTITTPTTITSKSALETTVKEVPIESGFESLQKSSSEKAIFGVSKLTGASPEAVRIGLKIQSQVSAEIANVSPTPLNLQMAAGTSEIKAAVEKPIEAGVYYGAGVGFGVAFKGAGAAFRGAQRIAAPAFVSTSGARVIPRSISTLGTITVEQGPKILTAVYGADVASRSTEGFTDFRPGSVVSKSTPIILQEAIPLGAGFGTVNAFERSIRGTKVGFQDYKTMLSERTSTTPIATLTTTEGKVAIGQIVPEKPTVLGYVKYEAQRSVPSSFYEASDYIRSSKGITRDIGNIPRRVGIAMDTARETVLETAPEYMYRAGERAYQTQIRISEKVPEYATRFSKVMAGSRSEVTTSRPGLTLTERPRSLIEPIYSKYFDVKLQAPISAERALISGETKSWEVIQKSKTPGITLKAAWQERGYTVGWEGSPRYSYTIQKKPSTQFLSIGEPGGIGNIGDRIKPSVGGTGVTLKTKPAFERISTKTVGGVKVSGLSMERPAKSTSSFGEVTKSKTIGQSSDFRGRPTSDTMKPMGKRAFSESVVITEKLPGFEQPVPKSIPSKPSFASYPALLQPVVSAGMQDLIRKPEVKPRGMEISRIENLEKSESLSQMRVFSIPQYQIEGRNAMEKSIGRITSKGVSSIESVMRTPDTTPDVRYDRDVRRSTIEIPSFETTPFSQTDIARISQTREQSLIDTKIETRERQSKAFDYGGLFPPYIGGGGSRGPMGSLGSTRWQRTNLVADMPYLARGMRSFGFSELPSDMYRESYRKGRKRTKKTSSRRKKK